MVYLTKGGRKGRRLRRRIGRGVFGRKAYSNYARGVNQLAKDVGFMKSVLNVEKMRVQTTLAMTESNTSYDGSNVLPLGPFLSQGDAINNRNGNSIKLAGLLIRGRFKQTASTDCMFRVMLIRQKQPDGTAITVGDILQSTGGANSLFSCLSFKAGSKYEIIFDRSYNMVADTQSQIIPFKTFVKLHLHTRYGSNNGNMSDIESNCYHLLVISDQPDASTTSPIFDGLCTFHYYDN